MIDSHCHLADEAFSADLDAVVERAIAAGLTGALCILAADDEAELERAGNVRRAWPAVRFAAAIHPHGAGPYAGRVGEAVSITRHAVHAASAVAVGEIGLEYHYDIAPRDVQRQVFGAHIELAVELDLPVVIHMREAADDTYAMVREAGGGRVRGVMHCFTGSIDEARRALELGFFISLAGILTFPKADALREVARFVPDDRVLVETDAPFLAPVPHRKKRNEPAFVVENVRKLAEIRNVPDETMAAIVVRNFETLTESRRVDTSAKPMV